MNQYYIYDDTANNGRHYIDENGNNCADIEQAELFETEQAAISFAEKITPKPDGIWEEWASIVETETNETKHTPGPWDIHGDFKEIHPLVDEDGLKVIADIDPDNTHLEESKANAALIAAAPDMLEALQYAKEALKDIMGASDNGECYSAKELNNIFGYVVEKARAAIAKAKAL